MSSFKSYVIRIYRKKGRETLIGQILEVPTGRKRSFATVGELQSAFSGMLGPPRAKGRPEKKRRREE